MNFAGETSVRGRRSEIFAIAGVLVLFGICAGTLVKGGKLAKASMVPLPDRMELVDAANARADRAQLELFQREAQPYADRLAAIYQKYKIDPDKLGNGIGINFMTGEITRGPQRPQEQPSPTAPHAITIPSPAKP